MVNTVKTPPELWLETAKSALIAEGVAGIKVDKIAKKLGVTRGGFYHHFKSQKDLLDRLIQYWIEKNDFLPKIEKLENANDAVSAIDQLVDHLVSEEVFSPAFEMAVREWARIDEKIAKKVEAVDRSRIYRMVPLFLKLGYDEREAILRARVFYFHQMGYYNLGHHTKQSKEQRMKNAPIYLRILFGRPYAEAISESRGVDLSEDTEYSIPV